MVSLTAWIYSNFSYLGNYVALAVHRIKALVVDELVQEAIEANNNNEMIEIVEEPTPTPVAETPLISTEPTIIDDNATGELTIAPAAGEGDFILLKTR